MSRRTIATISGSAFRNNLQVVRNLAPQSKVMAMVKANGYGHGIERVAKALTDADGFGVACTEEAIALRQENISHPIFLMEGFYHPSELSAVREHDLTLVLHHLWQLEALESCNPDDFKNPLKVWIKIDTGMHRLGFMPEQVKAVLERLQVLSFIHQPVHLMTHFAEVDTPSHCGLTAQLRQFNQLVQGLPGERSTANSGAVLTAPPSHMDWVRPGIMLYGASPMEQDLGAHHGLQPAMTLQSELIAVRHCRKGEAIGYGGTYVCPEPMSVGVVAIGYGDGYPRSARSGTPVWLHGKRAPLVGRVSMDMITIDLRQIPEATVNDKVILWGGPLPAEVVANYADTVAYELFCGVTSRVQFQVVD